MVKLIIRACRVAKVVQPGDRLFSLLRQLPKLKNRDVVAVSSKVIGILERRLVRKRDVKTKDDLIKAEADAYLPRGAWGRLTRKFSALSLAAGIDEFGEWFVLLPKNPDKSAMKIRNFLKGRNHLHELGVIITDSHTVPLRRGKLGYALGYAGFNPLRSYWGRKNVSGRIMVHTLANLADALSSAAVLAMGEGGERAPAAVIAGLPKDIFTKSNMTVPYSAFHVPARDDIFAPLLTSRSWKEKRKQKNRR